MAAYEQNIVLDLEFTPVDREARTDSFRSEIIQIAAVRVSPEGEMLDCFSAYVKPEYTQKVARSVQRLTGIRTCDLVGEQPIETVLEEFRSWVGARATRFVAWSGSDLRQLTSETEHKHIGFPEKDCRWLDLQKVYPRFMDVGDGNLMALRVAADWYGIRVSASELHGALYDARLTAELCSAIITKDYLKQKESLDSVMSRGSKTQAITFSLGDKFSSLQQLKTSLEVAV